MLARPRRSWRRSIAMAAAATAALAALAGPAQADNLPIVAGSIPVTATVGTPFSGPVATFSVSDPLVDISQYTASISWGDGSGSLATIGIDPSGGFVVSAIHTYLRAGTFNTTVLIAKPAGPNAVAFGTATVGTPVPSPTVTGIDPARGPATGGNSVTIAGTELAGATQVDFGLTPATSFHVDGPTQITATAPAGTGTADITVTTPGGTSLTSDADQYTYIPAPAVTAVDPDHGPAAGGTRVTITGTDLLGASDVEFGSNPATDINVDGPTQISATAPAGTGTADVTVTTPSGTSTTSDADEYTYIPAPAVTAVDPDHGPAAGGTRVTITGTDLLGASDVEFGSNPATDINVDGPTQITATAPPGTGTADITVTTPSGTSTTSDADQYAYIPAPSITAISPAAGPIAGGTTVTITGAEFDNATGVSFGSTPASSFHFESPTRITAVAPPGSDTADVIVTTPGGASATGPADRYRYVAPPVITGVSPSSGDATGGTSVKITGTDLADPTDVSFGSTPAAGFKVDGPTQITATAPAGTGTVDITVTTAGGTSATGDADRYAYVPGPVGPQTGTPTVVTESPTTPSSTGLLLAGSVNPQGLMTTAYFQYGLDSRYTRPDTSGPTYNESTSPLQVGSDFLSHPVLIPVAGLVPNALYHARLVATNTAGTTFGPDVTFMTPADPAPAAPQLASSFNVTPVSGLVLIQVHGKFVPLTEVRSIRAGALINTLHGTLKLITATGKKHKTQVGTFGGAVFKVTQFGSGKNKGLTTLALVEGAVKGGPSYASCKTHNSKNATIAALSKKTLQLLHSSDHHAKFRTKGRYSAATIRGTVWTTADRCDGTIVHVTRGVVDVTDFVRHITVVVRAGHTYLALAKPKKHK